MVYVDFPVAELREWATDELEDEASFSSESLWEAEVAALSDEQIASMQQSGEDDGIG